MAEFSETGEMPGVHPAEPPSLWEVLIRGLRLALDYERSARATVEDEVLSPGVSLVPTADPGPPGTVTLVPASQSPAQAWAARARDVYDTVSRWVSELWQLELRGRPGAGREPAARPGAGTIRSCTTP